jgi:predicted molibdopterin-dependent oxidoreductase YjgC
MAKTITISIDNHEIQCAEGTSILRAADTAGIYIPRLCDHPDLPPGPGTMSNARVYRHGEINADSNSLHKAYGGCNLCIVEIERKGVCQSCATLAEEGMVIHSETAAIKEARRTNLARILCQHPHSCLLCSESSGCDRESCMQGEIKQGRCCPKFDNCEFIKVCDYVTIRDDVSQYLFKDLPLVETPLFTVNTNLCIGCTRCIRACEKLQGKRVIGFTFHTDGFVWGTIGPTHKESGCVYCGACVAVCPTGSIMDKGLPWKKKEKLNFSPVVLPPIELCEITEGNIQKVPEANGVYQLFDEKKEIIYIRGAENLRIDLQDKVQSVGKARFFRFEEHDMYSMRENELLAQHLKKYGALPEVNNEISDLY